MEISISFASAFYIIATQCISAVQSKTTSKLYSWMESGRDSRYCLSLQQQNGQKQRTVSNENCNDPNAHLRGVPLCRKS